MLLYTSLPILIFFLIILIFFIIILTFYIIILLFTSLHYFLQHYTTFYIITLLFYNITLLFTSLHYFLQHYTTFLQRYTTSAAPAMQQNPCLLETALLLEAVHLGRLLVGVADVGDLAAVGEELAANGEGRQGPGAVDVDDRFGVLGVRVGVVVLESIL
jgi:hypothetical protein